MAARAGAEFCPIPIRQADLADDFADAIWHAETLCINAHGVAKYVLSRAVRDAGYKVVLTGEGSDEILAGYPHFRRDMLLYDSEGQDPAAIQRAAGAARTQQPGVARPAAAGRRGRAARRASQRMLGFVPSWMEAAAGADAEDAGAVVGRISRRVRGSRGLYGAARAVSTCAGSCSDARRCNQALYLWAKTVLPGYILTVLGDRMEMAHSVEGRVPFLDHQVVEVDLLACR